MGLKDKRASLFENISEPIEEEKNSSKEDENKNIKEDKNIGANEDRKKRGYLITKDNIKRLKELNYRFDEDLSDMVNEAIEDYYKKRLPD